MAGKKVYRSSQGKSVDLGALLLQNETVRAVGNMGVNARGDRIDIRNKIIDPKVRQRHRAYNKEIGPQDEIPQSFAPPVVAPDPQELQEQNNKEHNELKAQRKAEKVIAKAKKTDASTPIQPIVPPPPPPPPPVVEPTLPPVKEPEPTVQKKAGGLADAIAKAKVIKQEQLKTPRQQAQDKSGVKRI